MKVFFHILISLFFISAFAQNTSDNLDRYIEQVKERLVLLSKSEQVHDRFKVNSKGIHYLSHPANAMSDFTIPWEMKDSFLAFMRSSPTVFDIEKLYKSPVEFLQAQYPAQVRETSARIIKRDDLPLEGFTIAVDASKLSVTPKEAQTYEYFFVRLHRDSLDAQHDIFFYEADLNYQCATLVADHLARMGADVIRTRPYGVSPVGVSFSDWFQKKLFVQSAEECVNQGWVKKASLPHYQYVRDPMDIYPLYRTVDLRKRAELINKAIPDLTISISFNSSESAAGRMAGVYSPIAKTNFSMATVPGAFHLHELTEPEHIVEFVRLLLSDDLDSSIKASDIILNQLKTGLGVDRLFDYSPHHLIRNNANPTGIDGVFARNLFITRAVHSPVAVVYPVFQNNSNEALLLDDRVIQYSSPDGVSFKTSQRMLRISQSITQGISEALLGRGE